ncbi:MAG: tannase/feruloyl esterase family alpha/beta hydrolase [Hyphomonadaceae bacterium]|nr:tannase/feruloyl esterase family alpha/beta hydrolase [Hyphomonadaceae bacterium]
MRLLASIFVALAFAAIGEAHASCSDLRGARMGNAEVRAVQRVNAGAFTAPNAQPIEGMPAFCRVTLTARPSPQSNVTIEVWLPEREAWNGRLLGTGNGGFGGLIWFHALAGGVKRGYATAHTDLGTFPAGLVESGYDVGIGQPEMVRDWGRRATHEMTLAARAVIELYYAAPPRRAYFAGCSTGGHQALSEAQFFPEDYDAILAGAPGHNRTHLHAEFTRLFQSIARDPSVFATPERAAIVREALLAACGRGRDGGAPGDAFLNNPGACAFSPRRLLCAAGQDQATCLSGAEVAALEEVYAGARNPRTNEVFYSAWPFGAEAALRINGTPRSDPSVGRADGLLRWVMGARWDARTFDRDADLARIDAALGPDINALNANLSAFAARGGKLILYHGWDDPIVSALDTIAYVHRVRSETPNPDSFMRLFMAPGVSHCAGGPGPDLFGGQNGSLDPNDPERDVLAALDRWVESGRAPERVIAAKRGQDGAVTMTRPLCAYPRVARYVGRGDPNAAESFTCVRAREPRFAPPAPRYLQ